MTTNKLRTKWVLVAFLFTLAATSSVAIALAGSPSKKQHSVNVEELTHSADEAANSGNYFTALRLYRQLAEKGDARAQSILGVMLADDHPKEAVKWFKLSAAQGYAEAQYRLGWMYEEGNGVPQDKNEAMKWYKLAVAHGYKLGIKTQSTPAQGTRNEEQNAVAVSTRPGDMSAAIAVVQMNFDRADCPSVIRTQRFSDGTVKVICSSGEDFRVDFSGPFAKLAGKPVAIRCSAARDIGVGC